MPASTQAQSASSSPEVSETTLRPVLLVAMLMSIGPALVKALSPVVTLPGWDLDPTLFPSSVAGCTPWLAMVLDATSLLGCALALVATRSTLSTKAGVRLCLVMAAILLGAWPVLYHGWLSPFATIGQQRTGLGWLAAFAGAVAVARLGTVRGMLPLMLAVTVGFVACLFAKGAIQIFVEHQQTVDDYLADREGRLAALGWPVDSPMARAFERRIMQREASGWFGLSNVFGSIGAAMVAIGAGLTIAAWLLKRESSGLDRDDADPKPPSMVMPALVFLISAGCVAMAASKGATAAAALGLGLVGVRLVLRKRKLPGVVALIGPLACVGGIGAILLRGWAGDRLGDLSILFRWFYVQAASRIFADHPLLGVGPDGFKDAYLLAKNPLSPEEVQSPHSVFFDWTACLGISGFVWVMLTLVVMAVIVRNTLNAPPSSPTVAAANEEDRGADALVRPALLIVLATSLVALFLQRHELVPTDAAARVAGLIAWAICAVGLIKQPRVLLHPMARTGLAAGAITLAAHAQIEMTGTWIQSCGLAGIVLGLAACGGAEQSVTDKQPLPTRSPTRLARWPAPVAALPLAAIALASLAWGTVPAYRWQADLQAAAAGLQPIAEAQQLLRTAQTLPPGEAQLMADEAGASLSAILGTPAPARSSLQSVAALFELAQPIAADRAARILAVQTREGSFDQRVVREIIRLTPLTPAAEVSLTQGVIPPGSAAALVLADPRAGDSLTTASLPPWRAGLDATTASIFEFTFRTTLAKPGATPALAAAKRALELQKRARTADPHNLDLAFRMLVLSEDFAKVLMAGGPNPAQVAAAESLAPLARAVLVLNANNRLDPLRQLTDANRLRAERLAGAGR